MNKSAKKTYIHLAIAVVLFFLCRFAIFKPGDILTESGVGLLSVFLPTCYLWITCDVMWPSLLSCLMLAITGVMDMNTVFASSLGNYAPAIIFGYVLVVAALIEGGVLKMISRWIISRKVVQGRPYVFFAIFAIAVIVPGLIGGLTSLVLVGIPLAQEVCNSIGYTKNDKFYKALVCICLVTSPLVESAWPYGKVPSAVAYNICTAYGITISMLDIAKMACIFLAILVAALVLILKFFYKPDVSKFVKFDVEEVKQKMQEEKITAKGKAATVLMILMMIGLFAQTVNIPGISPFFSALGLGGTALLFCVIGMIIHVVGEPIIPGSYAVRTPISAVIFMSCILMYATAVMNSDYGISAYMASLLTPIVSKMGVLPIIMIALIAALVITNFASNLIIFVVLASATFPVLMAQGANPSLMAACGIMLSVMSNCGFLTAAGSTGTGMILATEKELKFKDYAGVIGLAVAACAIIGCAIMIPLGRLIL